jgi:protein TilB
MASKATQASRMKRVVTLELMRKRAEHNEGLVLDLEELALHQEDLEGIGTLLGRTCGKTLQILFLQNNIISSLPYSEMKGFKSLQYLNLALNNITHFEDRSLSSCECLEKLDLTLNFIDVEGLPSLVSNLSRIKTFRELYLLGNPCLGTANEQEVDGGNDDKDYPRGDSDETRNTKRGWRYCVQYIVAGLPQLEKLDGKSISRSDRIKANQQQKFMEGELSILIKNAKQGKEGQMGTEVDAIKEVTQEYYNSSPSEHSPAHRAQMSNEAAQRKAEKSEEEKMRYATPKGEAEWEDDQNLAVQREKEREAQGIVRQRNGNLLLDAK